MSVFVDLSISVSGFQGSPRPRVSARISAGINYTHRGPRRRRESDAPHFLHKWWESDVIPPLTCKLTISRIMKQSTPIRRRAPAALATGALRDRKMPLVGQRRPALPRTDSAVPSALGGLTSGFGMGPGVPPPPWSLTNKGHSLPGRPSPCPGGRTARRNRVPPARPHPTPHARKSRRRRARPISTARLNACWRLHLRPISS